MASVTEVETLTAEDEDDPEAGALRGVPPDVEVYEVNGPFFFGAADTFKHALAHIHRRPRVLVLRLRHVPALDATGLRALEDVLARTRREGTRLILSGVRDQPLAVMRRSGFLDALGEENLAPDIEAALERAGGVPRTEGALP